jgi:hypothetical protein
MEYLSVSHLVRKLMTTQGVICLRFLFLLVVWQTLKPLRCTKNMTFRCYYHLTHMKSEGLCGYEMLSMLTVDNFLKILTSKIRRLGNDK